jgi:RecB family exonuclease
MNQVTPNPMEWHYYTNKAKKRKIDELLKQAANLFANCGPTAAARKEALEKEKEIISQIAKIDRHFAERCGWDGN